MIDSICRWFQAGSGCWIFSRNQHWHYVISISRAGQREQFEVYLRTLREHLPWVAIPLRTPDRDVVLDLQEVFERCYEF
jgi:hypothetical protein